MNHGLPPENWDTQLTALNGHFLQSRVWARFQQSLDREVLWAQGEDWMWLAAVRGQKGLKYLLCSYGPTARNHKSAREAIRSLQEAGKRLGCDFVRIEPRSGLNGSTMRQLGGKQIGEVQPAHTQIIDLTQSVEDLRKSLASGHRNLINGTERRGIRIRTTSSEADIDEFMTMLTETAKRAHTTFYPDWYYRKLIAVLVPDNATLYLADAEGQSVAMAMFYDWEGTRYYAHAAAHQELNRRLNASVSLVWQALLDAKAAGAHSLDLWGVAPDGDSKHPYAGITKFKKAFGGQTFDYLGTWDLSIRHTKYRAYSVYRKLKGRQ